MKNPKRDAKMLLIPFMLLVTMLTIFSVSLISIYLLNKIGQNDPLSTAAKKQVITNRYDPLSQDPLFNKSEIEIMSMIEEMTLEQKVGQLFIGGSSKEDMLNEQLALVRDQHFGGIILFRVNVTDSAKRVLTMETIRQANSALPISPFIAIDEEGGEVTRLYGQLIQQTPQHLINSPSLAYETSLGRGRELIQMGMNMNLAPVMDYATNSESALYKRTFRGEREAIALLSENMLRGYKDAGIIAVPKHFPGHPDNNIDSHTALSEVGVTREQFDSFAGQFKSLIEKESPVAIMTAHVKFPAIDPVSPTTLSHPILTGILRNDYQYNGLIITDDMNMGAIKNFVPLEEGVIRAIEAGADMVVIVTLPKYQLSAYNALLEAVRSGRISEERIDESLMRILKVKKAYGILP